MIVECGTGTFTPTDNTPLVCPLGLISASCIVVEQLQPALGEEELYPTVKTEIMNLIAVTENLKSRIVILERAQ